MTVRQTKRLLLVTGGVLLAVTIAHLALVLVLHRDLSEALRVLPGAFVLLLLASTWRRLGLVEAEHGPNYVEPQSKHLKPLLIGVGALAVVLAAVVAYLVIRRG